MVFGTLLSGYMCGKHIICLVFAAWKLSISVWGICLLYLHHSRQGNRAMNDVTENRQLSKKLRIVPGLCRFFKVSGGAVTG